MDTIPSQISKFIKEHHVLTLATESGGELSCCNLFYSYLSQEQSLVFTSSIKTEHGVNMSNSNVVAASIVLETKVVGKIRGLQIKGTVKRLDGELESKARLNYLKRFPFAVVAPLELWILNITWAKLTDNRLGFGTKLIWTRDE